MTSTYLQIPPEFLKAISPFDQLKSEKLQSVAAKCEYVRYRMGQPILVRDKMPKQVIMIYVGQAQILGYDQRTEDLVSLEVVGTGTMLGWLGLLRGVSCEAAIAVTDVIAATLCVEDFWQLMATEPTFAQTVRDQTTLTEVFELLSIELQRRTDNVTDLKALALQVCQDAIVINCPKGKVSSAQFLPHLLWLVSAGSIGDVSMGDRFLLRDTPRTWQVEGSRGVRLLGLPSV